MQTAKGQLEEKSYIRGMNEEITRFKEVLNNYRVQEKKLKDDILSVQKIINALEAYEKQEHLQETTS